MYGGEGGHAEVGGIERLMCGRDVWEWKGGVQKWAGRKGNLDHGKELC